MISDADLEMAVPVPKPNKKNPFALGWRWRDGGTTVLPLTQADLLYQEEGDQIATNHGHAEDMRNLYHILSTRTAGKAGVRAFTDHCINFEVEGLGILGPDAILFNGEDREWDKGRGTFPVKSMGARPLYAFEITSPGTRGRDFRERLDQYYRAGVPVYVVIDAAYGGGRRPQGLVAFQAGPDGYERLAPDGGRVWIEVAEVFLSLEDDTIVAHTADGEKVLNMGEMATATAELANQVRQQQKSVDRANKKADAEKKKADTEKKKADTEKKKADTLRTERDELARKAAELEAELRRLRGE